MNAAAVIGGGAVVALLVVALLLALRRARRAEDARAELELARGRDQADRDAAIAAAAQKATEAAEARGQATRAQEARNGAQEEARDAIVSQLDHGDLDAALAALDERLRRRGAVPVAGAGGGAGDAGPAAVRPADGPGAGADGREGGR